MGTRRARGSITPKAVANAALAVADREGLAGVTIRAVANELGASAMSLYTHVANKEALFDLMFSEVLERLVQIDDHATWQADLEAGCAHARRVLLAHPQWIGLLSRVAVPPMAMRLYDRMLSLMAADGFTAEATMLTVSAAMSFTIGLVLTENMLAKEPPPIPERHLRTAEEHFQSLPAGMFPSLGLALATFRNWSFDRVFAAGLESLISGADRFRTPNSEVSKRALPTEEALKGVASKRDSGR